MGKNSEGCALELYADQMLLREIAALCPDFPQSIHPPSDRSSLQMYKAHKGVIVHLNVELECDSQSRRIWFHKVAWLL